MKFSFKADKPPFVNGQGPSVPEESDASAHRASASLSPPTATLRLLPIDQIKPYDRNPRRERNPRYPEIKASIRAQGGLNNPLTITQRPGEDRYMVESGGNTRLQVLTELYQETGDARFFQVHCLFRPWIAESHTLSAHLIENEFRGELVLIDKALALQDLKALLEAEAGESLSRNGFIRCLDELGYAVSKRQLIRLDYAGERLYPFIPIALRAGLGPKDIDRIRRLETAYHTYWDAYGQLAHENPRFDDLFGNALAANDGPEFELALVRQTLETSVAAVLNIAIKRLRLDLDALLKEPGKIPIVEEQTTADNHTTPAAAPAYPRPAKDADAASNQTAAALLPKEPPSQRKNPTSPLHPQFPPTVRQIANTTPVSEQQQTTPEQAILPESPPSVPHPAPVDIASLRQHNHALARRLAKRHRLEACLLGNRALGLGYLVDLPSAPFDPGDPEALFSQWIWWLLVSFSEATVQPERLQRIGSGHRLGNFILENRTDDIFAIVGEPDWRALGFQLLNDPALDDRDFDDLLQLAQNCRALRKLANDPGDLTLWGGESPP